MCRDQAVGFLCGQQGIEEEQAGADDHAGVGHVEVGPVVAEDVDLDEVDDRAVGDAVVDVAQRAAQNERQSHGREADAIAQADDDARARPARPADVKPTRPSAP